MQQPSTAQIQYFGLWRVFGLVLALGLFFLMAFCLFASGLGFSNNVFELTYISIAIITVKVEQHFELIGCHL